MKFIAMVRERLSTPKSRRYLIWLVGIFLTIGVLGGVVLPPIARNILENQLGQLLHRVVSVERISINPYALSVSVKNVSIGEKGSKAPTLQFDELTANLEGSSLFRGGIVLKELVLLNPKFSVTRATNGRLNISDVVDEFLARPKTDDPAPSFSISNIRLEGGNFRFQDALTDRVTVLSDVKLGVPFISNMKYAADVYVEPSFSAKLDGAPVVLKGKSKPFSESMESEIAFSLDKLKFADWMPYMAMVSPVALDAGSASGDVIVKFAISANNSPKVAVSGGIVLDNLRAVKAKTNEKLVTLNHFSVEVNDLDLMSRQYDVNKIKLQGLELFANVDQKGRPNWVFGKDGASASSSEKETDLKLTVADFSLSDSAVHWKDLSREKPIEAQIKNISVEGKKLANFGDSKGEVNASAQILVGEQLSIATVELSGHTPDYDKHEVALSRLRLFGVNAQLMRDVNGVFSWITPPLLAGIQDDAKAAKSTQKPWKISLASLQGDKVGATFDDSSVTPKAKTIVSDLSFELNDLVTDASKPAKLNASLKLNGQGVAKFNGEVTSSPFKAKIAFDMQSIELLPLQPYFSQWLNVEITQGKISTNGVADIKEKTNSSASSSAGFAGIEGSVTANVSVNDFYSVDKINAADFVSWKSLHVDKILALFAPQSISVGDVALSDFYARVIVGRDGKLNLMQVLKEASAPTTHVVPDASKGNVVSKKQRDKGDKSQVAQGSAEPSMPIKISRVTLQGGRVRFTDNFVKPNYTANLKQLGGRITGLSSEAGTVANLDIRGSYDGVAPVVVNARVNPLAAKPYLDLKAEVKGVELTSLSTYAGKYAGYEIDKGKLSLFVTYKIDNDKLEAENRLFLDQLTFGDRVDSPDATSLPVKLAVALLKNRNGEIDINLPISGSLNDPDFSIGGIVVKMFVNMLVKAVTSPFALLGSMFGSGEELSNIAFAPGYALITPGAKTKLDSLVKALIDRPALKLEIEGKGDSAVDIEGIKRARLDRLVKVQRRSSPVAAGGDVDAIDTDSVPAKEYPALLARVYKAAKFPKPRNMIGLAKDLPVEEMEKLLMANFEVTEDDLLEIADQRARAARDYLIAQGVSSERLFLRPGTVSANVGAPQSGGATGGRVEFSLE